jgi:hypothetical protein
MLLGRQHCQRLASSLHQFFTDRQAGKAGTAVRAIWLCRAVLWRWSEQVGTQAAAGGRAGGRGSSASRSTPAAATVAA